jgi:glyoxylase-like metal-dependent hydrolase (beta-lactamase superfamily II)
VIAAPGVLTISLPVPFELGSVNIHLVELEEGYMMVDAGHGTAACFDALEAGLAAHEVQWPEIKRLFLTHCHPDHVGLVEQIVERTQARVNMHPLDAVYAEEIASLGRPPVFEEAMRLAGVPEPLQLDMLRDLSQNRGEYRKVERFQPMEGGERISVKTGVLETVFTPGHSPGHLCLYSPEERYLISGDHLLRAISPNISWRPGEDMLAWYLDSLQTVKVLDVDLVVPSHGKAFQGHARLVDDLTFHHEQRAKTVLSFLGEGPHTAHELVGKMWRRQLPPVHHHFAAMEVLAHLEYLRRRGPVAAESGEAGSIQWLQMA